MKIEVDGVSKNKQRACGGLENKSSGYGNLPKQTESEEYIQMQTTYLSNKRRSYDDCLINRYKKCFRIAFELLTEHSNPKTTEDFIKISRAMGSYGNEPDQLLKGLLIECFNELERQCLSWNKGEV